MSDEPKARVKYVGGDKRISRVTVNGRKYDFDGADKGGFLMPLGDATALVAGEPAAYEFVSEARQDAVREYLPDVSEGTDKAVDNQGGRAVSENARPNTSKRG